MFSRFSEEAQKVLINSKKEMQDLKHSYIGSEHLFLSILNANTEVTNTLEDFGVTYMSFKNRLIEMVGVGNSENNLFLYTPILKKIIETAILFSKDSNNEVLLEYLVYALFEESDSLALQVLRSLDIDISNILEYFSQKITISKKGNKKKYSIEDFGVDLTKKASNNELDPVVGRDKEIERVMEILCRRNKNNPLLIGEAGVGKTAIVEELSRLIASGNVPDNLKNKRIISIAMASLVSGTKYRGEFEERITKMLKELESCNDIIIFIDEIHTLMGAGGAEGAIDAANIFKPMLARGNIQLIGATTVDEYKNSIEKDRAMARRFQNVNISEPSDDVVLDILVKLKPIYEGYHGVSVSLDNLKDIIYLTNKYIYDRKQPDKAIDILDEVCSRVSISDNNSLNKFNILKDELVNIRKFKKNALIKQNFEDALKYNNQEKEILSKINLFKLNNKNKKTKLVTNTDICNVISDKTKIPIYEFGLCNDKYIKSLNKKLVTNIYGQDEAINKLVSSTKKFKLGFKRDDKPISFLFVGPSGVGKTKLATTYAKCLYGENGLIKLDMSEYSDSSSLTKIMGSNPGYIGYDNNKNVLEEIRNNPNSVILLDEIDKADSSIINLFLSILDEGKIKDNKGNTIRFDNNIIIMTSNSGNFNKEVGFIDNKRNDSELRNVFSNEFLNRIQNIIYFKSLTDTDIKCILKNKLNVLKKEYALKNIKIHFNNKCIDNLISNSEYSKYGARKLDKLIDEDIVECIIDNILTGKNEIYVC